MGPSDCDGCLWKVFHGEQFKQLMVQQLHWNKRFEDLFACLKTCPPTEGKAPVGLRKDPKTKTNKHAAATFDTSLYAAFGGPRFLSQFHMRKTNTRLAVQRRLCTPTRPPLLRTQGANMQAMRSISCANKTRIASRWWLLRKMRKYQK